MENQVYTEKEQLIRLINRLVMNGASHALILEIMIDMLSDRERRKVGEHLDSMYLIAGTRLAYRGFNL